MLNEMDLEVASEFIIMASKLLEIKSRYLLYKQHHEDRIVSQGAQVYRTYEIGDGIKGKINQSFATALHSYHQLEYLDDIRESTLELLGLDPFLKMDMRLGEGSGAALAFNMIEVKTCSNDLHSYKDHLHEELSVGYIEKGAISLYGTFLFALFIKVIIL